MKQKKVLGIISGLFLLMIISKPARALTVQRANTNLFFPTNTPVPTLVSIKKIGTDLNLQLIPTATPTSSSIKLPIKLRPIVTLSVTATVTPKISPKVTPTITETAVTPTENPLETATITAFPTTTATQTGNNMTFWFLVVTIGLLAVIIIVQAWPKKGGEE